jgi:hypothetical protein
LLWTAFGATRALAASFVLAAAALAAFSTVELDAYRMMSGVFRYGRLFTPEDAKLVFYRDGRTASVSLVDFSDGRSIRTNGKSDGGVNMNGPPLSDETTMTLTAALPLAVKPEARRVAVIGIGTGITTHTLLGNFELETVDTIEIEAAMAQASRGFAPRNSSAFADPRSHIHIDDAKTYFSTHNRRYDVIISEPSNPWISGIGFLFTRESFQHMRAALNDGGVACQWLQIYDLTPEAIASVIRTFASVFPNTIVLKTQDEPSDLLLLGLKSETVVDGPLLDVADLEQAFARHRVAPEYAPYSPTMLDDLLGRFVVGPAAIADLVGHAPLNTDDGAYIEFEAPKQLATEGDMTPVALQLGAHWEPATRYLRILRDRGPAIDDRSKSLALHARLGLRANVNVFELVARPEQGNRQLPLATAQAIEDELNAFGDRFGPCSLLYHLAGMLAEMRALPGAQSPALERYGPGFDPAIGRQFLEQAAALDPSNIGAQLDLATNCEYGSGGIRFGPGSELRRAADLYRSILARTPDMPGVRERLAEVTRARSHS